MSIDRVGQVFLTPFAPTCLPYYYFQQSDLLECSAINSFSALFFCFEALLEVAILPISSTSY